jgi:hypothetical protein
VSDAYRRWHPEAPWCVLGDCVGVVIGFESVQCNIPLVSLGVTEGCLSERHGYWGRG